MIPNAVIPEQLAQLVYYANGQFVHGNEPGVSVWDHGFLYGDGIFEGIRVYGGKLFKLEAHLDRLFDSAKLLALDVPITREELRHAIIETVRRNQFYEAHVRPIISRGTGSPALGSFGQCSPNVWVLAYPHPAPTRRPIRAMVSTVRRKSPLSVDARVKSLNYLDSVLAKIQAYAAGYDDAIMLDPSGFVAEASGANIFSIHHGTVSTPTTEACLDGITRSVILSICSRLQIPWEQRHVTTGDLYVGEEVFLCGTGADLIPVGEIDGRTIGTGEMGNLTGHIAELFDQTKQDTDVLDVYAN